MSSLGAVKKHQAIELAKYARNTGMDLVYVFFKKPTPKQIALLREWIGEVADDVFVGINYLFE